MDGGPVVQLPALNAEELQLLMHGLDRVVPALDLRRHLDSFLPEEAARLGHSLATALLEALGEARRT